MIRGFHAIVSCYGFWLPNDPRGSWSDFVREWDLLRFGPATKVTTRRSLAGVSHDRSARLAAKRALRYPPVRLDGRQVEHAAEGIAGRWVHHSRPRHSAGSLAHRPRATQQTDRSDRCPSQGVSNQAPASGGVAPAGAVPEERRFTTHPVVAESLEGVHRFRRADGRSDSICAEQSRARGVGGAVLGGGCTVSCVRRGKAAALNVAPPHPRHHRHRNAPAPPFSAAAPPRSPCDDCIHARAGRPWSI